MNFNGSSRKSCAHRGKKIYKEYSRQEENNEQWHKRKDFRKYCVCDTYLNRDYIKEQNGNEIA